MNVMRPIRALSIAFFTVVSGLVLTLTFWLPNRGIYHFVSHRLWGPGLLWSAGVKIKIDGLENIKGLPPAIYFANHRSYYDIPAMMTALPLPMYFIAKVELRKVPFLGWAMRAVGMIFVDRKSPEKSKHSLQKAGLAVRSGKNIAAYPEGTRNVNQDLNTFKRGVFALAIQEGIPLVPVAIRGSDKILPPNGKLNPGRIDITLGHPISPEEMDGLNTRQLTQLAHKRLGTLLDTAARRQDNPNKKTIVPSPGN